MMIMFIVQLIFQVLIMLQQFIETSHFFFF